MQIFHIFIKLFYKQTYNSLKVHVKLDTYICKHFYDKCSVRTIQLVFVAVKRSSSIQRRALASFLCVCLFVCFVVFGA